MSAGAFLLVVDDNEFNRDALSRRLQQKGFAVTTACSGPEALEILDRERCDLVLLDVEMPEMSGLEVLSQLRITRSATELPVIMVTARTQGADVVEALGLGANDYVTKPVDFPVALARITTHLSLKSAMHRLRESEERYALAVEGANDGLWDWNLVTNEVYWSPRWKALLGYEEAEIGGSPEEWLKRVHPDDVERVRGLLEAHLGNAGGRYESEHRLLHRSDTYRWVRCRATAVRGRDGAATRLAGSLVDITDSKVADALTGLPNRLFFVELLDRANKRTLRRSDFRFALLMFELARFDVVNDSLGLLTADQLLVAVARRLQTSLRQTDAVAPKGPESTLARLGSDEFMVLLDDITGATDATRVADRLLEGLRQPFDVDGHEVFMSGAIGIALGNGTYHAPEEILRDAAIALRQAKTKAGPRYSLFDPAMRAGAESRLRLETDLHRAVEMDAFSVQYQPVVSLTDGDIVAFEALLRWKHPTRGWVSPADFIPVAEETGLLPEMERVTLVEPCRQMRVWQQQFGWLAPRFISVNVSSQRFEQGDLATDIEAMLRETGLDPSALKLEITESVLIGDLAAAKRTLDAIRQTGVEWSLDDFGTGYSSLSYLHQLPVNTVKVDRSFVSRIALEPIGFQLVRTIITLAHSLGMNVVCEGVETAEQVARLRELKCDYAQGFYFSPARDVADAERLIADQPWRSKPLHTLHR